MRVRSVTPTGAIFEQNFLRFLCEIIEGISDKRIPDEILTSGKKIAVRISYGIFVAIPGANLGRIPY